MLCAEELWIHPQAISIVIITEESQNIRHVDNVSTFSMLIPFVWVLFNKEICDADSS